MVKKLLKRVLVAGFLIRTFLTTTICYAQEATPESTPVPESQTQAQNIGSQVIFWGFILYTIAMLVFFIYKKSNLQKDNEIIEDYKDRYEQGQDFNDKVYEAKIIDYTSDSEVRFFGKSLQQLVCHYYDEDAKEIKEIIVNTGRFGDKASDYPVGSTIMIRIYVDGAVVYGEAENFAAVYDEFLMEKELIFANRRLKEYLEKEQTTESETEVSETE